MRAIFFSAILFLGLLISGISRAQDPTDTMGNNSSGAMQASNVLNPNVSAIGWFQIESGHRHVDPGQTDTSDAFQMKEAELGFQSIVDPWTRADFFVSVSPDNVDLEEGYVTFFKLPWGLGLKAGKFKTNFGRFNRIHTPETPFADRPLVQQNYFGDEGLNGPGVSASWEVPNPLFYTNIDLEAISAPKGTDNPSFSRADSKDVLYVGRLGTFFDLTESWNVAVGGDFSDGPAGTKFDAPSNSSSTLHSELYGFDVTFRWKNIRRAIYQSFLWSTEALWSKHETAAGTVDSLGWFSYFDYQFAQRWHTGFRYDYTQFPTDGARHQEGGLLFLTCYPSEFMLVSLQGRQVRYPDGVIEDLGFLKTTFNIGPHGAHPF